MYKFKENIEIVIGLERGPEEEHKRTHRVANNVPLWILRCWREPLTNPVEFCFFNRLETTDTGCSDSTTELILICIPSMWIQTFSPRNSSNRYYFFQFRPLLSKVYPTASSSRFHHVASIKLQVPKSKASKYGTTGFTCYHIIIIIIMLSYRNLRAQ